MSYLFGGKEFICDGCATGLGAAYDQHGWGRSPRRPDCLTITSEPRVEIEGRKCSDEIVRHYCAACAPVALDTFKQAFARPPLVLGMAEPEPEDALQRPEPPPKDPREIVFATRLTGRLTCPVDGTRIYSKAFRTFGKYFCSVECANTAEAAEHELAILRGQEQKT